MNKED
jgi:hypothetical protein